MRRRALLLLFAASLTSCKSGGGAAVKASADASEVILLVTNQEAEFSIDGKIIGKGKHIRVLVNDEPHHVVAKPLGYNAREEFIRPPYDDTVPYRFFFLMEDQEGFAARHAPPATPTTPAPPQAPPPVIAPPPPPPMLDTSAARVWTVAIGISKYSIPSISLKYADRDAQAIDRFFSSPGGGGVPNERRALLVNESAHRAAVLTTLTSVAKRAAPNDLVIIYLAMHGLPDEGGDLYFLTHDTDPRALVGTGLPQRDVEYALASSPARRVVMLIDACHAGAAGLGPGGKRGIVLAETNRLLSRLAKSKSGVAVLTASSATEPSNESEKWGGGHGVFTHYLLMGLSGHADADRDRLISIRELYDFVYGKVSQDTGGQQHPELKGTFDNGLPIAERK